MVDRLNAETSFYEKKALSDPMAEYERKYLLGGWIEYLVTLSVECYYGGRSDLGLTFARQARDCAARIVKDRRYETMPRRLDEDSQNYQKAETLHLAGVARFLCGEGFEPDMFVPAAVGLAKWADLFGFSDAQGEATLLRTVRLWLLGGDRDTARATLERKRKMKWQGPQRDALYALCSSKAPSESVVDNLGQTIDLFRDPDYRAGDHSDTVMIVLELAILRQQVLDQRVNVSLSDVISFVSRLVPQGCSPAMVHETFAIVTVG